MSHRDPLKLTRQAKGEFEVSTLSKTGGFFSTYLYDKPLIEYLESDEKPEFIEEISDSHKFSRGYSSSSNDLFARDGTGNSYLMLTDRRVICVMGSEDGDVAFDVAYNNISGVEVSDDTIQINILQDATVHSGNITSNTKRLKKYIEESSQEFGNEEQKPLVGDFYVRSSSAKNGSLTKFCKNGDYQIEFHSKKLTLASGSEKVDISYSSVKSAKFHESLSIKSNRVKSADRYDKKLIDYPKFDTIRLTIAEDGNTIHLYLMTNLSPSNYGQFHGYLYPSVSRAFECLHDEVSNNDNEANEKFVLNEWIERKAQLKIQEWNNKTVSRGPSMEGTIETEGKSKGTQVGPFIRSKSKSESKIQVEDSSVSIESGGYTEKIDCCIVYSDRIFVDTDPVIDISYEDVERVMKRKKGIAIQFNQLTYSIEKISRGEDEIKDAVEFIKNKIRESESEVQESTTEPVEKIRELKELERDGIITEEEFESKKQELLDQV